MLWTTKRSHLNWPATLFSALLALPGCGDITSQGPAGPGRESDGPTQARPSVQAIEAFSPQKMAAFLWPTPDQYKEVSPEGAPPYQQALPQIVAQALQQVTKITEVTKKDLAPALGHFRSLDCPCLAASEPDCPAPAPDATDCQQLGQKIARAKQTVRRHQMAMYGIITLKGKLQENFAFSALGRDSDLPQIIFSPLERRFQFPSLPQAQGPFSTELGNLRLEQADQKAGHWVFAAMPQHGQFQYLLDVRAEQGPLGVQLGGNIQKVEADGEKFLGRITIQ